MKLNVSVLIIGILIIWTGFSLTGCEESDDGIQEAQRLTRKGMDLIQAFDFQEGTADLKMALELDPNLAEAAISLQNAYKRMGLQEEHRKTLALADSLTANLEDDDRRMVAQLRLSHRPESRFHAIFDSLLTRLENEQPDNLHVMIAQATVVMRQGNYDKIVPILQRILNKNPNYAEAYNWLGHMELHVGHFDSAVEHMKKYAFLAPELANPHNSLGEVLMIKGDFEGAAAEFRQAIAMLPDFYQFYTNLAQTMLYRGMVKSGVELMNKVHTMVEGTTLGEEVDTSLMDIFLRLDMEEEAEQMSLAVVTKYPESDYSALVRAIRLGYQGKTRQSHAVMDSSLNHWRSQEIYHWVPQVKLGVLLKMRSYEAYMADIAGDPAQRVQKWQNLLATMANYAGIHELWWAKNKLASALLDNGQAREARTLLEPVLAANNRQIPALITAVKIDLALRDAQGARMALEQLKWSIQQSDEDYIGRFQAAELENQVKELEGHS